MSLAALKQKRKQLEEQREAANRPRAEWFKWSNNKNEDKNVVIVKFLQELDPDSELYDEKRGLGTVEVEHMAPGKEGFKCRLLCTLERDGQCYACERHAEDYKEGWKQRNNFYIWAAVDYNDGEGLRPVIISRNFTSSFVNQIISEIDDNGDLGGRNYKITKSGSGTTTSWDLREVKKQAPFDTDKLETTSIEEAVLRYVPYEEQAQTYGKVYSGPELDLGDDDLKKEAPQETGELKW